MFSKGRCERDLFPLPWPVSHFESLVPRIGDLFGIPLDDLRSGSRKAPVVEARSVFCFWAVRQAGYSAARAAACLHMTPPAVGYAAERGKAIVQGKGYSL